MVASSDGTRRTNRSRARVVCAPIRWTTPAGFSDDRIELPPRVLSGMLRDADLFSVAFRMASTICDGASRAGTLVDR